MPSQRILSASESYPLSARSMSSDSGDQSQVPCRALLPTAAHCCFCFCIQLYWEHLVPGTEFKSLLSLRLFKKIIQKGIPDDFKCGNMRTDARKRMMLGDEMRQLLLRETVTKFPQKSAAVHS